jgi:hypothetical protein
MIPHRKQRHRQERKAGQDKQHLADICLIGKLLQSPQNNQIDDRPGDHIGHGHKDQHLAG